MSFKGDMEQYLRGADISNYIAHNRELVRSGRISSHQADAFNNWLIKVSSLVEMTGQPFDVISACVPIPWRGYTSADGGSSVQAPEALRIDKNGVNLVFYDDTDV